ncbi:MAG: Phytochrome-like protein cph1 [Chromatiales bacterium USCg_Taylor]|nr:MAG: Phytochrome-like protein cph1 [Chromatiales bacterium USCg_Taylor]
MSLKDTPIRRKLMIVILLTSGVVLLLTCAAFIAYELLSFRQTMVRNVSTLGQIIAANSTAALAFANQDDATEVLAALKAERHVVAASLYDANGELFAKYPAGLPADAFPVAPERDAYRFEHSHLVSVQPVVQGNNKRLGTLYLKSDLGAMYERLRLYSGIAALVLAVSFLVAYLLSRVLQQQISQPILALAETAKAISDRRDYSVRATKRSQDELGLLTDAFNQMLTQIQEQDRALRESEERLRLLLSATHLAAWDWDIAGRRRWHQEDLGQMAAGVVEPEEGASARWFEQVHPEDRERVANRFHVLLAGGGRLWSEEYRYREPEGSYAYVLERGVVIRNNEGSPLRMVGAMLDITARKESEEKVRRLNEDLTAANQELEAFSYSVSHDLRAPLRHIDGFTGLLAKHLDPSLDAAGRRYLTKVSDAARQMAELIDDLLTFSRIGRTELRSARLDLSGLVEEVLRILEPETTGRDIEWVMSPLPEAQGDPQLLRLVFQNLIGNALKYSRPKPQARIEIGVIREGAELIFSIRDNGVGFDTCYVDRLFGVFQRLHSGAEFEGTGIGLANVKRIVHRHGGRVWADGAVGEGACFYFSLPAGGETSQSSLRQSASLP